MQSKSIEQNMTQADLRNETARLQAPQLGHFIYNPPALVHELMNAKRAEHAAKQKLRNQMITEVKLRQ